MTNHSPAKATLIVSGLFLGGLLCGTAAGWAAVARAQDPYVDLEVFVRVLDVIERDYVDEIPTDRLIHAAIEGMVGVLDRQSRWLDPSEYRHLQDDTEGQSTGLGIRVGEPGEDGAYPVVQVLPGSPARRDGIELGDQILEVDGHPIAGLPPEEVESRFRGSRGEPAVLTILRSGWASPQQVRTVRDRVHEPAIEAAMVGARVVYVRVIQFREGAARELELAVARAAEPPGVVAHVEDHP